MTNIAQQFADAEAWLRSVNPGLIPLLEPLVAAGRTPYAAAELIVAWDTHVPLTAADELAVLEAMGAGESFTAARLRLDVASQELRDALTAPLSPIRRFARWISDRLAPIPPLESDWTDPTAPIDTDQALAWLPDPPGDDMPETNRALRNEPAEARTARRSLTVDGVGVILASDLVDVLANVPDTAEVKVETATVSPAGFDHRPASERAWTVSATWEEPLEPIRTAFAYSVPGVVESVLPCGWPGPSTMTPAEVAEMIDTGASGGFVPGGPAGRCGGCRDLSPEHVIGCPAR